MDSSQIKASPAITFLWVHTFKIRVHPPAILPMLAVYGLPHLPPLCPHHAYVTNQCRLRWRLSVILQPVLKSRVWKLTGRCSTAGFRVVFWYVKYFGVRERSADGMCRPTELVDLFRLCSLSRLCRSSRRTTCVQSFSSSDALGANVLLIF